MDPTTELISVILLPVTLTLINIPGVLNLTLLKLTNPVTFTMHTTLKGNNNEAKSLSLSKSISP